MPALRKTAPSKLNAKLRPHEKMVMNAFRAPDLSGVADVKNMLQIHEMLLHVINRKETDMKWKLIVLVGIAVLVGSQTVYADQQETTVYLNTSIPLDKGKPTMSFGGSYSQTNAGGTTKMDVNTNGKDLNVNASHTQQQR